MKGIDRKGSEINNSFIVRMFPMCVSSGKRVEGRNKRRGLLNMVYCSTHVLNRTASPLHGSPEDRRARTAPFKSGVLHPVGMRFETDSKKRKPIQIWMWY